MCGWIKMNRFLLLTMTLIILMSALCIAESDTVCVKEIGSEVKTVKFSPDGQFIYAAAIGRKPMKLDAGTGEILKVYEGFVFEGNVFSLAMDISSDGEWLICGAYGNNMYIIDTETGFIVKTLKTDYQDIQLNKFNTVTITPDKRYIIATNMFAISPQETMNGLVIWDAQSGELIKVINSKDAMIAEASPDNLHFAVSYYDESPTDIKIYQVDTWETKSSLCCHSSLIQDISFSHDGSLLASGGSAGEIKIWDVEKRELKESIQDYGHLGSVAFADNLYLVYKGSEGTNPFKTKIWDIQNKKVIKSILTYPPNDIDVSKQNNIYYIAEAIGNYSILLHKFDPSVVSVPTDSDFGLTVSLSSNNATSSSSLNIDSDKEMLITLEVYDINSKTIFTKNILNLNLGRNEIDIRNGVLPVGVYFCRISDKSFSKTYKIMLEK